MAQDYELRKTCWRCKGDGIAEITIEDGERIEDPCTVCEGKGYSVEGYLVKIND